MISTDASQYLVRHEGWLYSCTAGQASGDEMQTFDGEIPDAEDGELADAASVGSDDTSTCAAGEVFARFLFVQGNAFC